MHVDRLQSLFYRNEGERSYGGSCDEEMPLEIETVVRLCFLFVDGLLSSLSSYIGKIMGRGVMPDWVDLKHFVLSCKRPV